MYGEEMCIPEGKRPLGNTGVDGRIILSWFFRK
jgi:hypothetical protein